MAKLDMYSILIVLVFTSTYQIFSTSKFLLIIRLHTKILFICWACAITASHLHSEVTC